MQSKVVLPDTIILDAGGLPSWVPADGRPASDALGAAASNLSLSCSQSQILSLGRSAGIVAILQSQLALSQHNLIIVGKIWAWADHNLSLSSFQSNKQAGFCDKKGKWGQEGRHPCRESGNSAGSSELRRRRIQARNGRGAHPSPTVPNSSRTPDRSGKRCLQPGFQWCLALCRW